MENKSQIKISVITPSIRKDLIGIVDKCLSRQTFESFEWIVGTRSEMIDDMKSNILKNTKKLLLIDEPKKRVGDFYSLCKCWNKAFANAKGELIVIICDGLWFKPDLLERLWGHYKVSPKRLVTCVGDQFTEIDSRGEPQNLAWSDPRRRGQGFYKVQADQMEMCVVSIPKQALIDCGGMDEEYDKGPAVGEKEMCLRMMILGYEMYEDENLEYKAIQHPRLSSNWDEMYFKVTAPLFTRHVKELGEGTRPLNVNELMKYNKGVNT